MRFVLAIALLIPICAAQTMRGTVGRAIRIGSAASAGNVIADWTGIDAMSNQSITTAQVGSTAWANFNATGATTDIVGQETAQCSGLYSAKCVQFTINTATASDGRAAIIYIDPTYATNMHHNQTRANGASTSGGLWFQYRIRVDSTGNTYLANTGAQIKNLLQRNNVCVGDTGDNWSDANGNCAGNYGFYMHGFGASFVGANPNIAVLDDSSAGGVFHTEAAGITTGVLVKCQARNDGSVGSGKCKVDGVELMNCDTAVGGCSAPFANFGSPAADSSPTIVGFQLGVRYFQHCSNGCSNTTFKVTVADVKVCDYDCVTY